MVVPDNVLFEGGAGETVRRKLLARVRRPHAAAPADRHLLRPGREGERPVLRPQAGAARRRGRKKLWIYDLRTNKHFTLKTNPLERADLDEFVACYHAENRHERKPTWSRDEPRRPLARLSPTTS